MLEKGITGFWHVDDEGISHHTDSFIKQIVRNLYQLRFLKVIKIEPPGISNNYHTLTIQARGDEFLILINSVHPYYCGAKKNGTWMNLDFTEIQFEIQNVIGDEMKYLEPEFLNQSLKSEHKINLSTTELDQIKYWKSQTIGEVIFNGYD